MKSTEEGKLENKIFIMLQVNGTFEIPTEVFYSELWGALEAER
jgi:hypothetical protein